MRFIQERILQVIENKGITPYRICKDLGLSMGYLDKRGAIGTDKYLKIIEYIPDINPHWLLTGEGSMLKGGAITNREVNNSNVGSKNSSVKVHANSDVSKLIDQQTKLMDQLAESQKQVSKLIDIISKK